MAFSELKRGPLPAATGATIAEVPLTTWGTTAAPNNPSDLVPPAACATPTVQYPARRPSVSTWIHNHVFLYALGDAKHKESRLHGVPNPGPSPPPRPGATIRAASTRPFATAPSASLRTAFRWTSGAGSAPAQRGRGDQFGGLLRPPRHRRLRGNLRSLNRLARRCGSGGRAPPVARKINNGPPQDEIANLGGTGRIRLTSTREPRHWWQAQYCPESVHSCIIMKY